MRDRSTWYSFVLMVTTLPEAEFRFQLLARGGGGSCTVQRIHCIHCLAMHASCFTGYKEQVNASSKRITITQSIVFLFSCVSILLVLLYLAARSTLPPPLVQWADSLHAFYQAWREVIINFINQIINEVTSESR